MGVGLLIGSYLINCPDEEDEAIQAPSYVSKKGDEVILTLDASTQSLLQIETALVQNNSIPESALIWYDSHEWVYVQKDATHFTRKMAGNISGEKIVTQGAQILFSEEFQGEVKPEE